MIACGLSAASLGPVRAGAVVKGPGNLLIGCDDFRLDPSGTIEARRHATLVYPDEKGSLADASFGPKVFSSDGVDIGKGIARSRGET